MGSHTPVLGVATGRPAAPALHRRLVAVAVSPMELLRPESDLARLIDGVGPVDLLLACEDGPVADPGPVGVLSYADYPDYDDPDPRRPRRRTRPDDEAGPPPAAEATPAADATGTEADVAGLPDLQLHRLGLRGPLGPGHENDLVAALSELVGFDPEPGVYCLAPAPVPADPSRAVIIRAAQRIARVYGIPLLRYRCLELSVVGKG